MSAESKEASKIILALDVDTVLKAKELIEATADHVRWVKVGLELIAAQKAAEVITIAQSCGKEVFYDIKAHDVPRTIGAAIRAGVKHGVRMINVHASAGIEGMMAAVANKGDALVLAVSVLTSHDTENAELDFGASRKAKVLEFARNAAYAGCDGLILSPKELSFLAGYSRRKAFPETQLEKLVKVVPGTRSPGADHNDQKNVETQEVAVQNGAHWLVIGSEITANPKLSPGDAAAALNERIAKAVAALGEGKANV